MGGKTSEIQLGICIPTFNRDKYLEKLLDSLLPQCEESDVYVYISDNSSEDETEQIVKNYQKIYENIIYNKNEKNIGFYKNLINVLKMAKTQYVWMMDDDDIIREGSIKSIMDAFQSNPDYLVLNSSDCTREMEIKEYKIIDCDQDKTFLPGEHSKLLFNLRKNSYYGIMVSMIIKSTIITDKLREMSSPKYEFFENSYLPLILFFRSIVGKTGLFLCDPLVLRRPNMRNSSKSSFDWFVGDRIIALNALRKYGYDEKIIKATVSTKLSSALFNVIVVKDSNPKVSTFNNFIKTTELMSTYEKVLYFLFDKVPMRGIKLIRNVMYKISGL